VSSELEQRLTDVLRAAEPDAAVTDRARRSALDQLPDEPRRVRSHHRLALVVALALAALALTGVTLASETVRNAVGLKREPAERPPQPARSPLPQGANGFATWVDGTGWVAAPGRNGAARGTYTALGLSPNALYVAAGNRDGLEALDPITLRPEIRHRTAGPVVALSWSPDGLLIAYVVDLGHRNALHLIEGDFDHDRVVDRSVRAITPSWRADVLALAYVDSDGRAVVRDLAHQRSAAVASPAGAVRALSFAPAGAALALATPGGVVVHHPAGAPTRLPVADARSFAWMSARALVVAAGRTLTQVTAGGRVLTAADATAPIGAIAVSPDRRSVALALRGERLQVVVVDPPDDGQLQVRQRLLDAPAPAGRPELSWQ
jgi:hypothetical protein